MEPSKPELACQRPRGWCEPGQGSGLKILPEPRSEQEWYLGNHVDLVTLVTSRLVAYP